MSEGSTDKTVQSQNIIVDSKFASEEKKDIENDCSNVMSDLKFELEENTSIESEDDDEDILILSLHNEMFLLLMTSGD
jgi:hypothetical protein